MKKQELLNILKKKASIIYETSKDFEGQDEKMAYGLRKEAWAYQNVIDMLESKKYYEEIKAILLKEDK